MWSLSTTIRLSQDVMDRFRAGGRGWLARINEAPRGWVNGTTPREARRGPRAHPQLIGLGGAILRVYWPLASSSSANASSALANRALRLFTISPTSAMASRVRALGTLSSSGKA